MAADKVFPTRSLAMSAEGFCDQYADGRAAKLWDVFIGDIKSRTENYKKFIIELLHQKGCKRVLDLACGTGIDSIMLLEEGFEVVSVDASDKMLKSALKTRWNRRKEAAFDNWIIEEANWLTLFDDVGHLIKDGFDAVICLGNSFTHLLDSYGDQREQKMALKNFERCVKPGGVLLIDHRNYDYLINTGHHPPNAIYFNNIHVDNIKVSVLFVSGQPAIVLMNYMVVSSDESKKNDSKPFKDGDNEFRLTLYPHRLQKFGNMLKEVFGPKSKHTAYGDFKPLETIENPGFYIHVMEKL